MHYRLAVVTAEAALHDQLKARLYAIEHPPLWRLYGAEEQVGHGLRALLDWKNAALGDGKTYPPLPDGAVLVTSADVTIARPDPAMDARAFDGDSLRERPDQARRAMRARACSAQLEVVGSSAR